MTFTPHGRHLIAGAWIAGDASFQSAPATGPTHAVARGDAATVARACQAAEDAFPTYAATTRAARATFLDAIADAIEARGADITEIATRESGLAAGRIDGERGRTTGQLRYFADHIRRGDHLDFRHDPALPERKPAPRPDLRLVQRPIGPVAVFGASNFPLAFSTAGGDTAAALAAGCPVVVKGHPAHPGTAEIVAEAVAEAIRKTGMPAGVFNLVQGDGHDIGAALVTDPNIKAVGFTGSLAAGRALADLCAARPEPIPFFGELGSVNPMFLLPAALANRAEALAEAWATSLTLGAGQFCTNPAIAVVIDGPDADRFVAALPAALGKVAPQTMLTDGIAAAYGRGTAAIAGTPGVLPIFLTRSAGRTASPNLFETTGAVFAATPALADEVFGPVGLVVRVRDGEAMRTTARGFAGQLTATLHLDEADIAVAKTLLPILERMAGRVLANGFPTGVEVADAMMHGGPWPASTNAGTTSVGSLSIRRFLRPVCYQNIPAALLDADLAG